MKYRDARLLKKGDTVTRKDGVVFTVESIELYGQFKTVKINCVYFSPGSIVETKTTVFNDEIE